MTKLATHFHSFPGGVHLEPRKTLSTTQPVRRLPLPARLIIPLHQHIGEAAEPVVKPGDKVAKGQCIARAHGYLSAPIHASSSGTVVDIVDHPIPHPSGLSAACIVIETDGADTWTTGRSSVADYARLEPSELRNRVRDAGIVGLGGAGFPTFIKMNPGAAGAIDLLILNAVECEPYITCDDMLCRERAPEILSGLRILRHALQAKTCVVAIEDNMPEAARAMQTAIEALDDDSIQLRLVPTIYPAGGEKQLIKVLTGEEVPSNGLPTDIGVVCQNVATAYAVHQSVIEGRPSISRIVTVTGDGIATPCNVEALVGTPMSELIEFCGGYTPRTDRLLMGGPMMGFALQTDRIPVIKTTNCLLASTPEGLPAPQPAMPCIRCGECAEVCPALLLPQHLYRHARNKDLERVQAFDLFDCIECGCCAHVCPSHIPLVHYYRYAKTEIWAKEREREKSDIARRRHEMRIARLEREKQERAQRMKAKRKALQDTDSGTTDPKRAAIQAALKRVAEKKAAQQARFTRPGAGDEADSTGETEN